MSSAAWRALLATRSSASSAVMDSEYLPLFFHAPMMQSYELTMEPLPCLPNMPATSAAVPPCAP